MFSPLPDAGGVGIGCVSPPDAGGTGIGCVPPPAGAVVGWVAAGVDCGACVGALPEAPPGGVVGCDAGCVPPCPMNGRLPQALSNRAPIIRTAGGKSRVLNGSSLHHMLFLYKKRDACHRRHTEERSSQAKLQMQIRSIVMSISFSKGWHCLGQKRDLPATL